MFAMKATTTRALAESTAHSYLSAIRGHLEAPPTEVCKQEEHLAVFVSLLLTLLLKHMSLHWLQDATWM
jgi:hypothetical protein